MKCPCLFACLFLSLVQSWAASPVQHSPVTATCRDLLDGPFLDFDADGDTMALGHFKRTAEEFSRVRRRLGWMKIPGRSVTFLVSAAPGKSQI